MVKVALIITAPVWVPLLVLGCCLVVSTTMLLDFALGDPDGDA